jgi:hypothetical protein
MKEDILEQLVDDYLKFNGFFTVHNVKFQPTATDPDYVCVWQNTEIKRQIFLLCSISKRREDIARDIEARLWEGCT